jgi:hypothetical protein
MTPRFRLLVTAGAGAALLAAAGTGSLLGPAADARGRILVVLEPAGGPGAAPERPRAGRSWIGVVSPGDPSPRILTEGFHAAWSPTPSFDGRRLVFAARRTPEAPVEIRERPILGGSSRRVTGGAGGAPADPAYLPGGRIVFADRAGDGVSLFSCEPDGSDLRRLTFGDHHDARPRVLDDGRILFERRGAAPTLMTIHPDGTGVAAYRGRAPEAAAPPAVPDGYAVAEAARAAPRPVPPVLTSVVQPGRRTGTLLCLDAYTSGIPGIAALPRGRIAAVRVGRADGGGKAPGGTAETLGEAPVHPDGSFFVEVPADTPLTLTLLGADGLPLASHAGGVWVRSNENRGCVGCHEPPHLVPENRRPIAVLGDPVRIGGAEAVALAARAEAAP